MAVGDNDALQMRLAHDAGFLDRVQFWAVKKARDVQGEDPATAGHALRSAFAAQVLGNPGLLATQLAVGLVTHVNLTSRNTVYDPATQTVASSVTGPELFAAIGDIWGVYSGL